MKGTVIACALVTLLLSVGTVLPVAVAAPTPPADPVRPTIREVVVQGFKDLPADVQQQVRTIAGTLEGRQLDPDKVSEIKDQILELDWFYRLDSHEEQVPEGVRLVLTVTENPVINDVTFVGNTQISTEELRKVVKTELHQVYNRKSGDQDARAIQELYAKRGMTQVRVIDANFSRITNTLEYYIFEPHIYEVRIEGCKKTKDYVVRRELEIKPGEVYDERKIAQSMLNLERLNIFNEVSATPTLGTLPGTMNLTFNLEERETGMAQFGVQHSSTESIIGFIDVSDINIFGSGQRVSVQGKFGDTRSYRLSYTNPWVDTRRTSLTTNLYDSSTLREVRVVSGRALYDEHRDGGSIVIGRPVGPGMRLYSTVRVDRIRGVSDSTDAQLLEVLKPVDVRSASLSLVRDTRNSFVNPLGGNYDLGTLEVAGFGGASFVKLSGEVRRYWVVRQPKDTEKPAANGALTTKKKQPWVLAARLSAGTAMGNPPFLDQYLLGGIASNTLRGYEDDRFPGRNMVVLNNELRVPLTDSLQAVGFIDLGDAWGGRFADTFGDKDLTLHMGYGVGLRVQTPIGPLRLDYALNGGGDSTFHFGVGSTF